MLAIRLSDDILERLSRLASKTGRTKTFYVREAILKHMDDLEDYYLCESIDNAIQSGEMQTYSIEEMEKELGLGN